MHVEWICAHYFDQRTKGPVDAALGLALFESAFIPDIMRVTIM
jgi:hypothetical protein